MSEPPYQPPLADWNAAWPEMTVRMSPMVADSLAETRALSKLGIAIAAMMPMIATTISSSIRVKPFCVFISVYLPLSPGNEPGYPRDKASPMPARSMLTTHLDIRTFR